MFPNIARLKGYTYKSNILCNIAIKYTNNESNVVTIKNFPKINIGSIPIMVHSKRCILHGMDSVKLSELGECPYDQGGYFIINGKEKVIISQEKKVNNILYINKTSDESIPLMASIKSISNEGFQSSRTNNISIYKHKISQDHPYKVERIMVRIEKTIEIPVMILFRALGITKDKDILNLIIYDTDSKNLQSQMMTILHYSIRDSEPIYSQKDALKFISQFSFI